ncbi:MAG: right-handed parallel beta-helix repeat-containing protein [Planctomycetota bacterium]
MFKNRLVTHFALAFAIPFTSLTPTHAEDVVPPNQAVNEAVISDYEADQARNLQRDNPNYVAPAVTWNQGIGRVVHVNPWHLQATDQGTGERDRPFRTVKAAVKAADDSKRANIGTRLLLHPGVYREPLLLPGWVKTRDTDAPLIIEGVRDVNGRGVVFTGSDTWVDGWQADAETPGLFWHAWPHDWGTAADPWGDLKMGDQQRMKPLARRYEMVRARGEIFRQVLDRAELEEGRYFVDETEDKLWLHLPEGQTPGEIEPEVAQRWLMLQVIGRRNVTLKGLTVEGTANGPARWNITLWDNHDLTIEDFTTRENNGGGISMAKTEHLTLRNFSSLRNGLSGGGMTKCRQVLAENLNLSFNNWRGDWAGFRGWDPAGMKALSIRDALFRNVHVEGNKSHGLWLDYDHRRVVVENLLSINNARHGIFIEANPGPVTLRNSVITGNEYGIEFANTINTTIENCIVFDNRRAQIDYYDNPGRRWIDRFDGREGVVEIADVTLINNVFASINTEAPLINAMMRESIWDSKTTDGNLWFSVSPEDAFYVAGLGYAFDTWQRLTGTSLTDRFADPMMAGEATDGLSFADDSPLLQRETWPQKEVAEIGLNAITDRVAARIRASWTRPYPRLADANGDAFTPIDLTGVANRPLVGDNAWIGIDLHQIEPGKHSFHGVPFVVGAPNSNGDIGVMLLSDQFTDTAGRPLPRTVELPVEAKAQAIYVLHACGYAPNRETIAKYTLVYEDGSAHAMNIDVLGGDVGNAGADMIDPLVAVSEIQDWWPLFHHFESTHARHVLLADKDNPLKDPRYLYTLELVNPSPEKRVRAFRAESIPETKATLMLLGVTAHTH